MTTRPLLDKKLTRLREYLLLLVSLTDSAIERAIEALRCRDAEAATAIIADDERINELRYKVEEACVTIIATQQPMASDLRFIIATDHLAVEIERMADHAAGIAALTIKMADQPLLKPLIDIPQMAMVAREMLAQAVRAFLEGDITAAKAVAARDDEIDQYYDQVLRELLTYMMEDPRNIQRATYLLWVAHGLERIGDRVVNICERVIFMQTGKFEELE